MKIQNINEDAIVIFFPSDHCYANEESFLSRVEEAVESADLNRERAILLAVPARKAETDYGWIELKPSALIGGDVRAVSRFWEKPDQEFANALWERGGLWNTAVMAGHVRTLLDMIRNTVPALYKRFQLAFWLGSRPDALERRMDLLYEDLEPADFSKTVLTTQVDRVAAFNIGDVGWDDLGDPQRVLAQREARNIAALSRAALAS